MISCDARRFGVYVLTLAAASLSQTHAADAPLLTLRDALELASAHNPDLVAFGLETEKVRMEAEANVLSPPLVLDFQLENFAGTGEASGAKALEATLQLSRIVELGGKALKRQEIGASELEHACGDAAGQARRSTS